MKNRASERKRWITERNQIMKTFGRLPRGLENWAKKELFEDVMFLAFNNKTKQAYCTVCETEFTMDKTMKFKHNETGICPVCGSAVTYHRDTVEKGSHSVKWTLVVQAHNNNVLLRYLCMTKDYSENFRKQEISYTEMIRTLITPQSCHKFEYSHIANNWLPYRDKVWNCFYQPSEYDTPKNGLKIYKPNLVKNTLAKTWAKYSAGDIIAQQDHITASFLLETYLKRYQYAPALELLTKVGFFELVMTYLRRYDDVIPCPRATDLRSALGLSAYQVKLLLSIKNPSRDNLGVARAYPNMSMEMFDLLKAYDTYRVRDILEFSQYGNVTKMLRYMRDHNVGYRSYGDHLSQLAELGINFTGKNLFPEDFNRVHADLTTRVVQLREDKKAKEIAEWDKIITAMHSEISATKPLTFKENGLIALFPASYSELAYEGDTLHHCVRTYAGKIAEGKTMVFFIRREEDPTTPYYTLEYKDGHIVQCRGKYNVSATGTVLDFAEHFTKNYEKHLAA